MAPAVLITPHGPSMFYRELSEEHGAVNLYGSQKVLEVLRIRLGGKIVAQRITEYLRGIGWWEKMERL